MLSGRWVVAPPRSHLTTKLNPSAQVAAMLLSIIIQSGTSSFSSPDLWKIFLYSVRQQLVTRRVEKCERGRDLNKIQCDSSQLFLCFNWFYWFSWGERILLFWISNWTTIFIWLAVSDWVSEATISSYGKYLDRGLGVCLVFIILHTRKFFHHLIFFHF